MSVNGYYIECDGCGRKERIPYIGALPDLKQLTKEQLEDLQQEDYCPECAKKEDI
ncbi:MAG: hypothetical protein V3R78_10260 [Thermodesulfobacteriota bacterium]